LNSKNLIITFTRNPELGKVKTRLAKTLGAQSALDIYSFLLQHTESVIREIEADKIVYYTVDIQKNDIWDNTIYQKQLQIEGDLGDKMCQAFKNGFNKGYSKIIIVGSDLYDLNSKHINQAFSALDNNDAVIGPALDGGYYLLGMKSLYSNVFQNKNWGTETVFNDTITD
jgi:rSAM/selenodomain-associated transferase 1